MKRLLFRLLKVSGAIASLIVSTLILTELILRGAQWGAEAGLQGGDPIRIAMERVVQRRIDRLWARPEHMRSHPFEPPFTVFLNDGFEDSERMRKIYEATRLEPNRTWNVSNFLRDPNENTEFRVSANSFGFRGVEYPFKKPRNTYRVIALGSYPTFGHGVNDDETYPAFLETALNRRFGKYRFEVWNGGRQGATAIMGLSRLLMDVMQYKPDLIVWDFGWIEFYLKKDISGRIRRLPAPFRLAVRICREAKAMRSFVCQRLFERINQLDRETAIEMWMSANRRMIDFTVAQNLPVLILHHQGVSIPASEYRVLSDPDRGLYFIDTAAFLYMRQPLAEDIQRFWSKSTNWMTEIGVSRDDVPNDPMYIYRTDAIQYNEIAYRLIGEALADPVYQILSHTRPR